MSTTNLIDLVTLLMENPPDPNEPIPLSNKPRTMYGATLPFHILSWIVVSYRLYVRFRIMKEPWWDDYLIFASAVFNSVSMAGFLGAVNSGLGRHLLSMDFAAITSFMKFLYILNAGYLPVSGLCKLSLLCQYLRVFEAGVIRKICYALIVCVSLWASVWVFMGWFPCFPVHGFWNRAIPAKCWGMGYSNLKGFQKSNVAFSASNMILDTIIFVVPLSVYFKPGIGRRQVLALLALFLLGSIVVLMAVLRFDTVLKHRLSNVVSLDFTWWLPLPLIYSCLEVDFAIITASIPIFWPVIVAALPHIFVTHEVHVTHDKVPEEGASDFELDARHSLTSNNSEEVLTVGKVPMGMQYAYELDPGKVARQTSEVKVEGPSRGRRVS